RAKHSLDEVLRRRLRTGVDARHDAELSARDGDRLLDVRDRREDRDRREGLLAIERILGADLGEHGERMVVAGAEARGERRAVGERGAGIEGAPLEIGDAAVLLGAHERRTAPGIRRGVRAGHLLRGAGPVDDSRRELDDPTPKRIENLSVDEDLLDRATTLARGDRLAV